MFWDYHTQCSPAPMRAIGVYLIALGIVVAHIFLIIGAIVNLYLCQSFSGKWRRPLSAFALDCNIRYLGQVGIICKYIVIARGYKRTGQNRKKNKLCIFLSWVKQH